MIRVLVIIAVAMLAAGLDSSASAKQAAALDPCKLVTAADAKAVLGTVVLPCKRVDSTEFRNGEYWAAPQGNDHVIVQSKRISKAGFQTVEKDALRFGTSATVSGLGPGVSAYHTAGILVVWRNGNEAIFLVVRPGTPAQVLNRAITLAKRALPRM